MNTITKIIDVIFNYKTRENLAIKRLNIFKCIFFVVSASVFLNAPVLSAVIRIDTGFYLPVEMWHSQSIYLKYGQKNSKYENKCHLANDYSVAEGATVYAVADGVVESANLSASNYGGDTPAVAGGAIVIKHRRANGDAFYALYGHVKNFQVAAGDRVYAGKRIADVGPYTSEGVKLPHLHFGINSGVPSNAGYTPTAACTDYLGFVDPENYLSTNRPWAIPEFHGAGSLIAPSQNCYGCNKDTDAIHATGKAGLVLFQWRNTPSQCDHIDIVMDNMSYGKTVEIRSGAWDSRSSDKSYVATLPVSVEADGRTPWNVTAIKLDPFTSPASLTATCKVASVSPKVGTKTVKPNSNSLGIDLENGWIWQGNASLISDTSGTDLGTIGITRDVVNLSHPKGAAFFQWKKSFQCQNLKITAGVPGNYKLRMRFWNSSPVPTTIKPLVLSRDVYLSSSEATVLNYAEVAATFNTSYYLLSVYSDININASVFNPINVSCSAF